MNAKRHGAGGGHHGTPALALGCAPLLEQRASAEYFPKAALRLFSACADYRRARLRDLVPSLIAPPRGHEMQAALRPGTGELHEL